MKRFVIATTAVALFAAAYPATAQQEDLKVYISADMEGVVGVVTSDQLGPSGFEYQRFRAIMTREVNAAIDAAREMGATEILVSDSHGNGENLLIEDLPPDVQLIRAWPRPHMMMEGIDETFDAAIFIGYHSSTTNTRGVRAHTISSANLTAVRLNGVEMLEALEGLVEDPEMVLPDRTVVPGRVMRTERTQSGAGSRCAEAGAAISNTSRVASRRSTA